MSDEGRTPNTVKGNRKSSSGNSVANSLDLMMENFVKSNVNTAAVVKVTGCDEPGPEGAAGYVTVQPMVAPVDNFGEAIPTVEAFQLPFLRYQGGKAAVVIDPQPGDIGLAVYTKSDSSGVGQGQEDTVTPASNRTFDQGNGYYIGGFTNTAPEIYIELNKDGEINIKGKADITIETEGALKIKAASIEIDGAMSAKGGLVNEGGKITSNSVTLDTHTHVGDSGGTTAPPNAGT